MPDVGGGGGGGSGSGGGGERGLGGKEGGGGGVEGSGAGGGGGGSGGDTSTAGGDTARAGDGESAGGEEVEAGVGSAYSRKLGRGSADEAAGGDDGSGASNESMLSNSTRTARPVTASDSAATTRIAVVEHQDGRPGLMLLLRGSVRLRPERPPLIFWTYPGRLPLPPASRGKISTVCSAHGWYIALEVLPLERFEDLACCLAISRSSFASMLMLCGAKDHDFSTVAVGRPAQRGGRRARSATIEWCTGSVARPAAPRACWSLARTRRAPQAIRAHACADRSPA